MIPLFLKHENCRCCPYSMYIAGLLLLQFRDQLRR